MREQRIGAAILIACFFAACDGGPTTPSYNCTVTIQKHGDSNPHPRIFVQVVVQTATGSGSGSTQAEALDAARRDACGRLDLTASERRQCEQGTSPDLDGRVPLLSETSRRCSGQFSS